MENLYKNNTPNNFWRLLSHSPIDLKQWNFQVQCAKDILPPEVLSKGSDPATLVQMVLGEGQFGTNHWQLSYAKRLYYLIKPFLPKYIRLNLRKIIQNKQVNVLGLKWPEENRYTDFLFQIVWNLLDELKIDSLPFIHFWPDDHQYAFILTHDVELQAGHDFVPEVMELEKKYGFRSSFNFVANKYTVNPDLLTYLHKEGFEVGVHGLKHDGKLFSSRKLFEQRCQLINECLKKWNAVGFRSPLTLRNPDWMQSLDIEYDLSFFDTDPFEPIPGGTMSIWPFFIGHFVELPYTLLQDHTLLNVLDAKTPSGWLNKVKYIEENCGMALINVHPDYLRSPADWRVYEEFLQEMSKRTGYWHTLPQEVAKWWRKRSTVEAFLENGHWVIPNLPEATIRYIYKNKRIIAN